MKTAAVILLALLLAPLTNRAQDDGKEWVLEKEKNNIKIWTCKVGTSNFKSLKAVTTYQASVKQLADILNDAASYPEWMADLESTEILKEVNENERYYYFLVDVPWPLSNRDNIIHFTLTKDPATKGFTAIIRGVADYLPEKPGITRIPKSMGSWQIQPKGQDEIKLTFIYTADPGGKIPAWAVNMFIVDGPIKTLRNLREYLKTKNLNNN